MLKTALESVACTKIQYYWKWEKEHNYNWYHAHIRAQSKSIHSHIVSTVCTYICWKLIYLAFLFIFWCIKFICCMHNNSYFNQKTIYIIFKLTEERYPERSLPSYESEHYCSSDGRVSSCDAWSSSGQCYWITGLSLRLETVWSVLLHDGHW